MHYIENKYALTQHLHTHTLDFFKGSEEPKPDLGPELDWVQMNA